MYRLPTVRVCKEVIIYVGCPGANVDSHDCRDFALWENSGGVVLKSQMHAGAPTNVQC